MIPHDHVTIDGDTALWVDGGPDSDWPVERLKYLNRPCDTCRNRFDGQSGYVYTSNLESIPCRSCGGTGRHTFTVEVHYGSGNTYGGRTRGEPLGVEFRAHVIDVEEIPTNAALSVLPSAAEAGMWLVRLKVHQ